MAGVISVGGLASGLDTNKLIDSLVALERRPIDLLQAEITDVQASQGSLATLGSKLSAVKTAADALKTAGTFLVRKAASSASSIVTAAAGAGAAPGSVSITVSQLAHGSVASAGTGVASASATIAATDGTFSFQVGAGDVQTVNVTASTTLQDLVNEINDLDAGVTASAVNLGTEASPDYRLQVVSTATGASSTITVTHDDTSLAVATTLAGQNAEFTIAGFTGTFQRESNTFSDVLPGVTMSLQAAGQATITITDDADTITTNVKALVTAFNDAIGFVAGQSDVTKNEDGTMSVGSLAVNSTARLLIDQLHATFSAPLAGATTQYVNLASVGLATQQDGTIRFDESAFRTALGADAESVADVFAGNGTAAGIANDLSTFVATATGPGGAISIGTSSLADRVRSLQDQIDSDQRALDAYTADLRQQFTALETLVGDMQSQGAFLSQAFQ